MKLSLPLVALAVLFVQRPQIVRGADLDRILAILDAIKGRQDSYNPVDVHYKVKRTLTKYYFASAQRIDPSDRRLFSSLRDITTVLQSQYSVKGDRLFSAVESPVISSDGELKDKSRAISAYDGTLYKTTSGEGKVVSISRKKPAVQDPLSTYNGEQMLIRLLPSLKAGAKPDTVIVTDNPTQGPAAALHFRMTFGKGDQESIQDVWVSSAEKGYCVIRYESRLGGKLFHEYSECEYKPVDGIWFPFKAMYRNHYHNKDIHQVAKEERFDVERLTCRADEIPDTQFVIPVTDETELLDYDRNNLRIIGTDKVDKQIREAVAEVEQERAGGGWQPWFYASASVLLLVGAFYLGVRIVLGRRKGKRAVT